jgi:hypothetical protein
MDARLIKVALLLSVFSSLGATYRTPNFVVEAPTAEIAQQVATAAEHYRDEIAIDWLGKTLPRWYKPCPIHVKVGQIGAGGATTFSFDRGEVFGWKMNVQGTLERILDSVIPHEVSHTVFACHFRRPLPRWADEGAATLVEHESERKRQQLLLKQVLESNKRIPLKDLLAMKEYPEDMENVLALYAEGYSLADFLVQGGGKVRYLKFLEAAHHRGWDAALHEHYSLENVADLERRWDSWILAGSPPLAQPDGEQVAVAHPSDAGSAQPGSTPAAGQNLVAATNPNSVGAPAPSAPEAPAPSSVNVAQADVNPVVRSQSPEARQPRPAAEQVASNIHWNPLALARRPRPAPLAQKQPVRTAQVHGPTGSTQTVPGEQKFSTDDSLEQARFPHRGPTSPSSPLVENASRNPFSP